MMNSVIQMLWPPVPVGNILAGKKVSLANRILSIFLDFLFTALWGKKHISVVVWAEDGPDFQDSSSWHQEQMLKRAKRRWW